jgi:hypothetical protein
MGLMIKRVHLMAGGVGLLTLVACLIATAAAWTGGNNQAIASVKRAVLWAMLIFVLAIAAAGASGFTLARKRTDRLTVLKKRRMMVIVPVSLFVLLPAAVYLDYLAGRGDFGAAFDAVQILELVGGVIVACIMALNTRDGMRLTRKLPMHAVVRK